MTATIKPLTISNHKLDWSRVEKELEVGPPMLPKGIVIHFTATYALKPTIEWFKAQKVDIHNIIDRDGAIIQMFPYNTMADHAGESSWNGFKGLNRGFVGIEVMCIGPLKNGDRGEMLDCYGKVWKGETVYNPMLGYNYWEPFTQAQMTSLLESCVAICHHYKIDPMNICGHHEASPGRKLDPGGSMLIPMKDFREMVANRLRYSK